MGVIKTAVGVTNDMQNVSTIDSANNISGGTIRDKNDNVKSWSERLASISSRPSIDTRTDRLLNISRIDPRLDGFGTVSTSGKITGQSAPTTQFTKKNGMGKMGLGKILLIGAAIYFGIKLLS